MGSAESEKYCLKWNDFTSNLSSAFSELRDDEDFFDVTLLTEESEIRCHKLILGACSPHFRQIIKRLTAVQNPAIYLRGVRHEDIKNILEFMYLGEVNVAQEDLDSFLSVAQDLCIKGLTQQDGSGGGNQSGNQSQQSIKNTSSGPQPGPASKRPRLMKNGGENVKNVNTPKREPKPEPPEPVEVIDDDEQAQMESYDEYYEAGPSESGGDDSKDEQDELACEINEYVTSMSGRTEEGRYRCLICGLTCRDLYNQREHLMTHMIRDEKFKNRMESFMKANVIKDPKSSVTTCLICSANIGPMRKHFLSKHLREPKSNFVQLPDESF